jgi:Hemerythrin HHE cation binding domain
MISTSRPDTLTPIHKGLRRSLFETAVLLARTDFADAGERGAAQQAVATCLAFLREHAEHEDRHVVPVIAQHNPELAIALEVAHPRLERMAIAVDSLWSRFAPLDGTGRTTLGAELQRRFQAFVAEQLLHMDLEERQVLEVLWAALTDEQMAALSGRIATSVPPARAQEWGALLGPSLNGAERALMAARPPAV